jgi:hypothetical protein
LGDFHHTLLGLGATRPTGVGLSEAMLNIAQTKVLADRAA